jgi:dTDP-4-amino-4,6-dideoxygalactose transaminase
VPTNDPGLAAQVRLLGAHGSSEKYRHEALGFDSRLDSVLAVVLKAKLARLRTWNERRRSRVTVRPGS